MSKPNPHSKDEKTSLNNKLTKSAAHRRDKAEAHVRRGNKGLSEKEFRKVHGATLKSAFLLLQRKVALTKKKEAFVLGYFNAKDEKFDLKQCEQELSLVDKEFELARATLRAGLGDRPIHVRLPINVANTATAGGVVDAAVALNASGATEWTAFAGLFDEFKTVGGHYHFATHNSTIQTLGTNITLDTAFVGMSYDADSTVPGSNIAICQFAQHRLFTLPIVCPAASSTRAVVDEREYRFHIPPGTVIPSGAASLPGTEWQTTAAPAPVGYLKIFGTFASASVAAVSGVLYLNCAFRCRT
jgi:hypothetical protein